MVVTPVQRRLLVVDPCDDCHELLPGLRTAGWEVDSCGVRQRGRPAAVPATSGRHCTAALPTASNLIRLTRASATVLLAALQ